MEMERENAKIVQSKDGEITWRLEPFTNEGKASSANIIKVNPGITRYAISKINNINFLFK